MCMGMCEVAESTHAYLKTQTKSNRSNSINQVEYADVVILNKDELLPAPRRGVLRDVRTV